MAANKERRKATSAAHYMANKERLLERSAARYSADPERRRLVIAAWREKNQDLVRAMYQNRRAKKKASGKLSIGLISRLFDLQRGKCACCGVGLGADYEVDHILPIALGGGNTDDNVQLLRKVCNRRKSAKHPIDYMQSKGKLL